MKRIAVYLAGAAIIPFFGHFQESMTYQDGVIIHAAKLYDQRLGIGIALMIIAAASVGILSGWRWYRVRFRDFACVFAGAFALPALWDHWSVSRYGGGGVTTEVITGLGGPLAGSLFLAAAIAFMAAEACYRIRRSPDDTSQA
jgi:hypothetical protein